MQTQIVLMWSEKWAFHAWDRSITGMSATSRWREGLCSCGRWNIYLKGSFIKLIIFSL